jgi:Spy/CpxP family protein refolding chaperone
MKRAFMQGALTVCLVAGLAVPSVWADPDSKEYGHGKEGSAHDRGGYGGHRMGMMHGGASHFIAHLLKHEKEIGLQADQVAKLKDLQLNLDKTRIKSEADIQVAERELRALVEDEKSDMGAIEAKLKQSAELQTTLRFASVKTRREAMSILTPDQRAKEKSGHDRAMQEHRAGKGSGH